MDITSEEADIIDLFKSSTKITPHRPNSYEKSFPLEWFDDDETSPFEKHIKYGTKIIGMAYLPRGFSIDNHFEDDANEWSKVLVLSYHMEERTCGLTTRKTNEYYTIPRIYVKPLIEDPKEYIKRVRAAFRYREQLVLSLKMGTILDSISLVGVSLPTDEMKVKIRNFYGSIENQNEDRINKVLGDAFTDYQCTEAMLEMEHFYRKNDLYGHYAFSRPLYLRREDSASIRQQRQQKRISCWSDPKGFESVSWRFKLSSILCHSEIIYALQQIYLENESVSKLCLFSISMNGKTTLSDFEMGQKGAIDMTMNYVRNNWTENCAITVRKWLQVHAKKGSGSFNVTTKRWEIYKLSKVIRLLASIRFRMENSLRDLVENSVKTYCNRLCSPCTTFKNITENFEWEQDLRSSPFCGPGSVNPAFYVTLQMNEEQGAFYSVDPNDFTLAILRAYDNAINKTHSIEIIDPSIMKQLTFADGLYLSSIGLSSEIINLHRETLRSNYETAAIPMEAYARKFNEFVDIYVLDVEVFMNKIGEGTSSAELKELIEQYIQSKDRIQEDLPNDIVIGPFNVNVFDLKDVIIRKHETLIKKLLEYLAERLTAETQSISNEFSSLFERLSRQPTSIEELVATNEWIAELPGIVATLEHRSKLKMYEYGILDAFWHQLDDSDASVKWGVVIFPYKIRMQVGSSEAMFEVAIEQFGKKQTSDLVAFGEQVEILNQNVFQFCNQSDVSRANEFAVEANKLWNAISDADKLGRLLNRCQTFLGRPMFDTSNTSKLLETFEPFRIMWVTAADFLKLRETSFGNPLQNIDLDRIRESAMLSRERLESSSVAFQELPSILNVIHQFSNEIQGFIEAIEIMEYIKNPHWILLHWQELAKATGVNIRPSTALNFKFCIDKGILQFRDIVRDISLSATANKRLFEEQQREEERRKKQEEDLRLLLRTRRRGRKLV